MTPCWRFHSQATASATGSAALVLEGGVTTYPSRLRMPRGSKQTGPRPERCLTASITTASGGQSCLKGESAIEADVKLFAHVLFVNADLTLYHGEFLHSTFLNICVASGGSPSGSGGGGNGQTGGNGGTSGPDGRLR